MEKRCRDCSRICKWLDASDLPVKYTFEYLTPQQILALMKLAFSNHFISSLKIDQIAASQGNQLALLLSSATNLDDESLTITFIAQSERGANGCTELWFRYGVDEALCRFPFILDDFQVMVLDVLETLYANDTLLSASHGQ